MFAAVRSLHALQKTERQQNSIHPLPERQFTLAPLTPSQCPYSKTKPSSFWSVDWEGGGRGVLNQILVFLPIKCPLILQPSSIVFDTRNLFSIVIRNRVLWAGCRGIGTIVLYAPVEILLLLHNSGQHLGVEGIIPFEATILPPRSPSPTLSSPPTCRTLHSQMMAHTAILLLQQQMC